MIVRTCARLPGRPEVLWPLLCSSWAVTLRAGVYKSATTRAAASRSAKAAAAAGFLPGPSSRTR